MKIVIKAENRKYPDNIGDYLWQSIKPAADQLGIDLVRLPAKKLYERYVFSVAASAEIEWINDANPDLFIFFTNWVHGTRSRKIAREYNKINCPVLFWSREDPNHYDHFLSDAIHADIIGTCCSDCIPKYEERFPEKKVISLPMAIAPEIFYPPESEVKCDYRNDEVWYTPECRNGRLWGQGREDDEQYRGEINENYGPCPQCHGSGKRKNEYADRDWDIVFLGNRYVTRQIRNDAEQAVIIAAAKWATANGKKMGVWGHDGKPYGWWRVPEIYNTGIYQGRCDRLEAADIYRNAKVALSVSSNDWSPTMAPNRVVQIAACGTILIAYKSPATWWQTGGNALISHSDSTTNYYLYHIFTDEDIYTGARAHVLAHHTFKHRLETITEAMK